MKILCSISSIEFTCEHFPGTFHSSETFHPVFNLPQKKLLSYTSKWASGQLTSTDSYLLFLAILKSSDLVSFRSPAFRSETTDSTVAQSMEKLMAAVIKLNTVTSPELYFPSYVVTPDNRYLDNVKYWIDNWEESFKAYKSKANRDYDYRKLLVREMALQRMIKNPHKKISQYSGQIADWAAVAGNFPTFNITSPITGLQVTLADYWKVLINRCTKKESVFQISDNDLKELYDHCLEHIDFGTIYSGALFKVLTEAIEKKKNYLGLGDMDLRTNFTILDVPTTVEEKNMIALVASAPEHEPKQEDYPSKFEFTRAKMRWAMAQKFGAKKPPEEDEGVEA